MMFLRSRKVQRQKDLDFSIMLTRTLNVTCYFLFCFILIPGILRVVLVEKSVLVKMKLTGPLWNCLFGAFKYTVLLRQAGRIRRCVKLMGEDWNIVDDDKDYSIMRQEAKVGRRLAVYAAVFMYAGGLPYRTIMPLSKGTTVTSDNFTIKALACPSYFVFFNENLSPAYEIVFTLQFFAGFDVYTVSCAVCGLSAVLVMHACGQLKVLMRKMKVLTDGSYQTGKDVRKQLAVVVRHHVRMKSFLKQTVDTIQCLCLLEIVGCAFLVCLVGYYVVLEWENSEPTAMLTYFVILTSFGVNIFVLCYIGELLMEQSEKAGVTSYTISWYKLPNDVARSLVLIIVVSNSSAKITAGKLMDLSLNSFSGILKTSLAYFNILRSMIT